LKPFENIGLGGTFDRLHSGHKLFLDIAAHYGQSIHIGLITPSYLTKKRKILSEKIQDYQTRRQNIINHYSQHKTPISISDINDIGMDRDLATDASLSALVVSQETISGAITINELRKKDDKKRLTIIVVPRVIRDDGSLESSTRLRKEEQLDF
jgi:pantetheine-phosphate adenylyltransferase